VLFHPSEQAWQLLTAERARGGAEYAILWGNLREIVTDPDRGEPTKLAGAEPGDRAHRCDRWRLIYGRAEDGTIELRRIVKLIAF